MNSTVAPVSAELHERRERVFLMLAGIFVGAMAMLNIIGITKFIHIGPLALAVGVLPYPLTFLCTDLISELYGKRRANWLVMVGLVVNLMVIGTLWLGEMAPDVAEAAQTPWQNLHLSEPIYLADGRQVSGKVSFFSILYACAAGSMIASMFAYMAAQFCDVSLFHFWKNLTKGKHLWLRNNGSTLISQLVDTVMVISITFGAAYWRGDMKLGDLLLLIGSGYMFKMVVALLDTGPLYLAVHYLSRYLEIDPNQEHNIDREETAAVG